jgi:hypothetical protein
MAGAVVAGLHPNFTEAQKELTGLKSKIYQPSPKAHATSTT